MESAQVGQLGLSFCLAGSSPLQLHAPCGFLLQPPLQGVSMQPNPSLKLTRYGRHCKPGLSHSYYRLSPGLQYLATREA
jgi:hypothetical protein